MIQIGIVMVLVLIYLLLHKFKPKTAEYIRVLIFATFMRTRIQSYFNKSIEAMQLLQQLDFLNYKLYLNFVVMFALPIYSYKTLKKNSDFLHMPGIKSWYGGFYQNLDIDKATVFVFLSYFCLRRFIVAFFTVFLVDHIYVNLFVNILCTFLLFKFYDQKPMESGQI